MTIEKTRRRMAPRLMAALVAVGVLAGFATTTAASAKPAKLKVMTRNLYLGADLAPALLATSQVELFEEAFKVTDAVRETNFTARARKLADEVQVDKPHLIGLQEVALWRRGPKGVFDGPATPATEVVYDFLDELRNQLRNRGLKYKVAVVQQETDFEVPADNVDDGMLGNGGNPSNLRDVRLTMRDAILVRKGVRVRKTESDNFNTALPVDIAPDGPGPEDISAPRGWTAANVVYKHKRLRFVNTHLEAFSAFIRKAQASELVFAGGPTTSNLPVILVGDLNSDPDDPSISPSPPEPIATPNAAAYGLIAGDAYNEGAGFVDRGVTVNTCCHDADLLNPVASFDSRIDHILTNAPGRIKKISAKLIGADPAFRTPTGLWPSDHGGVVARLRVR